MLNSASVCKSLASARARLCSSPDSKFPRLDRLAILIVSSTGELISTADGSQGPGYCEKIAAVASSLAVEYTAMHSLMANVFTGYSWKTDNSSVVCSPLCQMKDGGSVFLVLALPDSSVHGGDGHVNTFLQRVASRIVEDLSPYLSPLLENMVSGTSESE